jgi:magnesium-transporting ATPase (P-type)
MLKKLPLLLALLFGILFGIQVYVPHFLSQELVRVSGNWDITVAFFAAFIGIYSLTYYHIMRIRRRTARWPYSIITISAMVGMAGVGFYIHFFTNAQAFNDSRYVFSKMFQYVFLPLISTTFALLGFYIASAAARAFRARNVEATLLLITAIIVMLAVVSVGSIFGEHFLPNIAYWILQWPNLAARRAIIIGVGLGGAATALKILLGIERSYLGM